MKSYPFIRSVCKISFLQSIMSILKTCLRKRNLLVVVVFFHKQTSGKKRKKYFLKAAVLKFRYHTPSKSINYFNYIYIGINCIWWWSWEIRQQCYSKGIIISTVTLEKKCIFFQGACYSYDKWSPVYTTALLLKSTELYFCTEKRMCYKLYVP